MTTKHMADFPNAWFEKVIKTTYVNQISKELSPNGQVPPLIGKDLASLVDLLPFLDDMQAGESVDAGIFFGAKVPDLAHGALAYAATSAATAKQVLQTIGKYVAIRHHFFDYLVFEDTQHTIFAFKERMPLGKYQLFIEQATLYTLLKLMQSALGDSIIEQCHIKVNWADPQIGARQPLGVKLQISYQQKQTQIFMPENVGKQVCLTADHNLFIQACRMCDEEMIALSGSFSSRVKQALPMDNAQWRSLKDIAHLLNVSPRTLIRQLQKEGTSYRKLIDEARFKQACFYLTNTQLPISQIAFNLGYQDASNFSRTFVRWQGEAPGQYRQLNRSNETQESK